MTVTRELYSDFHTQAMRNCLFFINFAKDYFLSNGKLY